MTVILVVLRHKHKARVNTGPFILYSPFVAQKHVRAGGTVGLTFPGVPHTPNRNAVPHLLGVHDRSEKRHRYGYRDWIE